MSLTRCCFLIVASLCVDRIVNELVAAEIRGEIREAEIMMRAEGISILDTTTKSIEELATTILQIANLHRHVY